MQSVQEKSSQSDEVLKKELLRSLGTLAEKNLKAYEHAIDDFRSAFTLLSNDQTPRNDHNLK